MAYDSALIKALRAPFLAPLRRMAVWLLDRIPLRVIARLRGGGKMYVDLSSAVGRGIWLTGEFDAAVAGAFERLLRPGDVVLDAGANCGFFSLLASRLVGASGLVIAVDMHHRSLELLRATRRRFSIDNVVIVEAAVGANPSLVAAEIARDSAFSRLAAPGSPSSGIRIPMLRIDDIVPPELWPRVRLIKMDIEGSEPAALEGARGLLSQAHPALAIEVSQANLAHFGYSVGDVFSRLEPLGYRCVTLDGKRPLEAADVGRETYNVLLEHRDS